MPDILSDINRSIIEGAIAVYIGPNRVEVQAADGEVLVPTSSASVAPVIISRATISGGPEIGSIVGGPASTFSGTPTPVVTHRWYKGGGLVNGEDGLTIDTSNYEDGTYQRRDTATNSAGSVVATTNTVQIEKAITPPTGIDYSRALVYFDANTPFTGTASDVTAITSRGSAGLSLAKTGTAAVRRTAEGFVFADTGYVSASGIPAGAVTDGMFLVVDFTQTSAGSNWARLSDGTGSRMRLQINSGSQGIIGTGADDTSVNIALGTATLGTRHVVAFEMDDVLNQLTGYDASGASVGPIAHAGLTDPVNTRIDIGQYVNGTIHRWCLVGRTEGGARPLTMAEVVADFRTGA